jgi:RimJ/RimL family protein N-acetyltransferase
MIEILTDRLILRPFRPDDLPALVGYRSQPDVARYQSWDETFSMADAEEFLDSQRGIAFGERGKWLQLAAIERASGAVCGDCAVCVVLDQPATAEIGVTLSPAYQGMGLATEALGALVAELFGTLGLHRVYARADGRNNSVHRLLERLGLRCEARLVEADWFKGEWTTVCVFAALASEWKPI